MNTIAIIGCGKPQTINPGHKVGWAIAYAHADGYRTVFPKARLSAVDPNAENLNAFADKWDIPPARRFASTDALYAALTPDAVSICTWPALHVPQALDAIHRGVKAITIEKPLGLDGMEILELLDAAKNSTSRVAVAHQRRYEAPFVAAKEIIASGRLGENLVIEGRVGDGWDILSWTTHWFDMANFLFDSLPTSILAGVDHTGERRYGHAVENASVVFADYPNSRQAVFITGPAALPHFGITIRGTKGTLHIGGSELELWTTTGYEKIVPNPPAFPTAFAALFADLWNTPADKASRCDLTRCAPATLIAYAAHESARTHRKVALPLTTWFPPLEVLQHPAITASKKLAVTVIADAHHEWQSPDRTVIISGRDGLSLALRALGHDVTLLDASAPLAPDALAHTDLVVIYHTQQQTHPTHRAALNPWFQAKKPVIISHCGIGAYADWPDYRTWIGRYWVWGGEPLPPSGHPHVPSTITVNDPVRFTVPWSSAWLPTDEMYQRLGEASPIRPLATATAPNGAQEIFAWQVINHPHVVVWLPGHRADMFALDTIRDGFAALIRTLQGNL